MTILHVEDMTCGGCVAAITRAVQALDAGARVAADLQTHEVKVESAAAAEAVAAAVRQAGFTVRPA